MDEDNPNTFWNRPPEDWVPEVHGTDLHNPDRCPHSLSDNAQGVFPGSRGCRWRSVCSDDAGFHPRVKTRQNSLTESRVVDVNIQLGHRHPAGHDLARLVHHFGQSLWIMRLFAFPVPGLDTLNGQKEMHRPGCGFQPVGEFPTISAVPISFSTANPCLRRLLQIRSSCRFLNRRLTG